jgi:hypothetical protein
MSAFTAIHCHSSRHSPFQALFAALPQVVVRDGIPDFAATPHDTLRAIAENAEVATRTLHHGMSAIGELLALSAAEVDCGDLNVSTIEAYGWLFAELASLAATCDLWAAQCRSELAAPSHATPPGPKRTRKPAGPR